jgi:N-hydroxyarylamine O-acetyltransferase
MDLDAYFRRIGYAGDRSPTLATLGAIQLHHVEAIAFENLDPLLGQPVRLDPQSLETKLVRARRGGWCFEHNLLLSHVLRALGFSVAGLAARVLWNVPEATATPRTHMLLRVQVQGEPVLVDVGFGLLTPTAPLRLVTGAAQRTPHEPFRLVAHADGYLMQVQLRGAWKPLYAFDLQEQQQVDYELVNWYLSNHPGSRFVNGLMAARAVPGRRYTLRDNEFAVHDVDGESERRVLADATALRATLEDVFGLALAGMPGLDAALERLVARAR